MNIHSLVVDTASQTAPKRPDKRQAILDAALRLFADKGFHGTAVPEIAKLAKVGAGTVYRYFESKDALVNVLYRLHKQALTSSILARIHPELPAREQFHAYWQGMADFSVDHPSAFRFLELHHHMPYLDDESRALEHTVVGLARATFDAFRVQQIVKEVDAGVVMAVVHGAFVGMHKAKDGEYLELTPENIDAAEQCVWEAIRR
jgi:TetR/AcrR family transcriptional regulator, repressor of fatR-cypB operon